MISASKDLYVETPLLTKNKSKRLNFDPFGRMIERFLQSQSAPAGFGSCTTHPWCRRKSKYHDFKKIPAFRQPSLAQILHTTLHQGECYHLPADSEPNNP